MNQDIAAIRRWHAAMEKHGPKVIDFGGAEACYVHDVRMLIAHIDRLERERVAIAEAATDVMLPIAGSPCEPWYVKGWNDALRSAEPPMRTAFNRCRLFGKDSHDQERAVFEALASLRRLARPPGH